MSAKYTSQWTQRAKIGSIKQDLVDAIMADVKAEKITIETLAENSALQQFGILVSMWDTALHAGMDTMDSLAEGILYQQATKIRNYRSNAYPMSERQVQVIWNRLSSWVRMDAKTW